MEILLGFLSLGLPCRIFLPARSAASDLSPTLSLPRTRALAFLSLSLTLMAQSLSLSLYLSLSLPLPLSLFLFLSLCQLSEVHVVVQKRAMQQDMDGTVASPSTTHPSLSHIPQPRSQSLTDTTTPFR